jgi:hypothetical protein
VVAKLVVVVTKVSQVVVEDKMGNLDIKVDISTVVRLGFALVNFVGLRDTKL